MQPFRRYMQRANRLFSHAAGRCPYWAIRPQAMVESCESFPRARRPEAILVVSAHWEGGRPTLLGSPRRHAFDYTAFPDEAYQVTIPRRHPGLSDTSSKCRGGRHSGARR